MLRMIVFGALSVAALASPASSQRAPQANGTQQVPAELPAPLPSFAAKIEGTNVAIPHLQGHCSVDPKRSPWNAFTEAFGGDGVVIGVTVGCQDAQLRAGQGVNSLEMFIFVALKDAPTSLDKQQAAKTDCDVASASGSFRALNSAKHYDRLAELENLVLVGGEKDTRALIGPSKRACYFAAVSRKGKNGDRVYSTIGAITQVKGRSVNISALSINGAGLIRLRQRAATLVEALSKQNGES